MKEYNNSDTNGGITAKIKPRIDLENRTRLETVIPLSVPYIINIDPCDKCNFRCKFCPTADHELMRATPGRYHGRLDFELYKKIIDDICEFAEPIKVLRLYKDGEPLVHDKFAEMIRYAKASGCAERVDTTTNASLLSPAKGIEIIEAGLDRINISIYGMRPEQYREFSKYNINFEKLVENITHFYQYKKKKWGDEHAEKCEMIVKINGDIISKEDAEKFAEIFGNIADGIYIEHVMSCWPQYDLKEKGVQVNQELGIYGQTIKEVKTCPYIFYSFSVNSDGTASTCFLDWSRKLIIGDTKTQSVKEIWHGAPLKAHQQMMLEGKRKEHPVCGSCGQMSHGLPDDIDPYADKLLEKLLAKI